MSETLNAKLTEMLQKDHMMNSEEMRVINCRGRFITIENNEIRLSLLLLRLSFTQRECIIQLI